MNSLRSKDIKILSRRLAHLENRVKAHAHLPSSDYDRAEAEALRRLLEVAANVKED